MSLEKIKQRGLKRAIERFEKKEAREKGGFSAGKTCLKALAVVLILNLNWFGLFAVGNTFAYFSDQEMAQENSLTAGTLDFFVTNQNVEGFVGMENNGEIFHTSVAIPQSGSMPMQYFAYSTSTSPVCSEFRVRVKQNEAEIFNGPLPDFLSATTTVFGTWKFEFDLPIGTSVTQEDLCQANITFSAWREEIENPEESGFFDIETLSLNLKAKTIVLNEVLANPNPSHPYPANREFIELKNNGNAPVDVAGWKVSEMTSGGAENKYTITTAGGSYTASPYGGSTIIPSGGWLVLLLSNLNNSGDTIRLYDSGNNKLDEYSYEAAKYGMSDARYLDGVGAWVDPIPTPGKMNVLEGENVAMASPILLQTNEIISQESVINKLITEDLTLEEQITETEEATTTEEITEEEIIETESNASPSELSQPEQESELEAIISQENLIIDEQATVLEEQPTILSEDIPATISSENTNEVPAGDVPSGTNEPVSDSSSQNSAPAVENPPADSPAISESL